MAGHNIAGPMPVAYDAAAVTPSDTTDLPGGPCVALYVGGAGTLKVDTGNGSTVSFTNVGVGTLWLKVRRVYATGTAATGIVAFY